MIPFFFLTKSIFLFPSLSSTAGFFRFVEILLVVLLVFFVTFALNFKHSSLLSVKKKSFKTR